LVVKDDCHRSRALGDRLRAA